MNQADNKAAFAKGMADRGEGHKIEYNDASDRAVYPSTPDRLAYPKDGMTPTDTRFAMQESSAPTNDRMKTKLGYNAVT